MEKKIIELLTEKEELANREIARALGKHENYTREVLRRLVKKGTVTFRVIKKYQNRRFRGRKNFEVRVYRLKNHYAKSGSDFA